MSDGSHVAFFASPDNPFIFKRQHDFDLHAALEVEDGFMHKIIKKAKLLGIETPASVIAALSIQFVFVILTVTS